MSVPDATTGQAQILIPELVVRVDYEIPPTRGISSMYFEEIESYSDECYEQALHKVHETAIVRGIQRRLPATNKV